MTHEVEVTVKFKVRVHTAHGIPKPKRAVDEAKRDVAGFVVNKVKGYAAHKGDFGWTIIAGE